MNFTWSGLRTWVLGNLIRNNLKAIGGEDLQAAFLALMDGVEARAAWSPVFGMVARGNDLVIKITDWQGSSETYIPKPAANLYFGAGGFTPDINLGVNLRGLQGLSPVLAAVDGLPNNGVPTKVLKVSGYNLDGTFIAETVNRYLTNGGTYTTDIAYATDIRGTNGFDGVGWRGGTVVPTLANQPQRADGRLDYYFRIDTGDIYRQLGSGNWSLVGKIRGLQPRGAWAQNTDYNVDDTVTNAGGSWRRTVAGNSGMGTFDTANWEAIALKGDPGTLTASAFFDIVAPLLTDKLVYQRADGSLGKADPSTGYPAIRPTLLLDFVGAGMVSQSIAQSRTGVLSYFDKLGTMRFAPANVPVIDYDPLTGRCLGLSVWQARTNLVRNSMMVGAVAGSPGTIPTNWNDSQSYGGIARSSVALATEMGIPCVDLTYNGTATSTQPFILDVNSSNYAVTPGQIVNGSLYVKTTGIGPTTIEMRYTCFDSGNSALTDQATASVAIPTGTLGRVSFSTPAMPANTTSVRIWFVMRSNAVVGTAYNFTLRVGGPQIEIGGAYATPLIPTTNAAATRGSTLFSLDLLASWFRQGQGSFYAEAQQVTGGDTSAAVFDLWQDSNNKISLRPSQLLVASTAAGSTGGGGFPQGSVQRMGFRYGPGEVKMYRNGVVSMTVTPSSIAQAFSKMYIGVTDTSLVYFNGYIRTIRYYPTLLTDSQLIAITSY